MITLAKSKLARAKITITLQLKYCFRKMKRVKSSRKRSKQPQS